MKKILTLMFCVGMFGQNYNTTNFDIDSNFSIIKNQITAEYSKRVINYAGNRYYFKKPQNALIFLFDGEKPINVKTNYNLLEQTFDIDAENNKTLKLLSNKVSRVSFAEKDFISIKGKFYELITETENFSLLADTFLELYEPNYTAGIQEKPDPTYRKNNSLLLYAKNKMKKIERRKKFLLSMFSKNMSKEINIYMKKNKISPSDNEDLSNLFFEFFKYLKF